MVDDSFKVCPYFSDLQHQLVNAEATATMPAPPAATAPTLNVLAELTSGLDTKGTVAVHAPQTIEMSSSVAIRKAVCGWLNSPSRP